MGRKKIYTTIRIETIENTIGLYLGKREYSAADAIRFLHRDIQLNEGNIEQHEQRVRQTLLEWSS